jgi:hypothetical protein
MQLRANGKSSRVTLDAGQKIVVFTGDIRL